MEEQIVKPQPEKKTNKKMILSLVVIIFVLVVIVLGYNQIISFLGVPNKETVIELSTCQTMMNEWCNECFSINQRTDVWDVAGNKVGEGLAKCSNEYFQTSWTSGQDCTGDALNYCLPQLDVSIE